MVSVVYEAPDLIEGAVNLLAKSDIPAHVLAGGTDLIIQTNNSSDAERLIVDVKKIAGMTDANLTDAALELGPSMSCASFTERDDIKAVYPGLVEAAYLIGSTQVQGRASVGGNLCNSSPAADTIPALIANGAQCVIAGPNGERTVPVEEFVTGVGQNCMEKGELLKQITVPRPAANTSDAYLRFIPRTEMDIAVAGAGVSVTLDDTGTCTAARVAIGAVAPTALLVPEAADALVGSKLDEAALQAAADAASAASNPITDRRGTVEYRRQVVGVLVKRAASIAAERAKEG
ncbi:MAG: xanthine dehydrogenase family protein subunit M [Pseudomonadales bacterium]|nr:xanthine dehydrogenase family protein subunit M [Pseudomonadales bacterium]